jgi:hypothetical protein
VGWRQLSELPTKNRDKIRLTMKCVAAVLLSVACAFAQEPESQPRYVDPGPPPGDAVVVFDGNSLSGLVDGQGNAITWELKDGVMVSRTNMERPGTNHVFSKEKFADAQVHIEFSVPSMPDKSGQARGNSGVYLQGRYEIQILDSYQNPTYATGMCGALYGLAAPQVNACRLPEQWQSYDIVFHPPKCDSGGGYVRPGSVTVMQNGVLILDQARVVGNERCDASPGPLMLQDHFHPDAKETPMRFRNIWFRRIDEVQQLEGPMPRGSSRRSTQE